ncbi:hypothetical protein N7532_006255 [Penicillium argentinense]|uniref:Uncharacterized protein n=1 Tax=Penicillium argentinense TaxID=1131581 RepID=A0A9W9KAK3_9EURO|nr:uncharacterized protein N7532_006255 [Penicillium argentinense]KAJ5099254.1 hypothetical protein N7532_006255 [Penicillium argentinense]
MEHVSTLCALSTFAIAPTGLALGRAEKSKKAPKSDLLRRRLSQPPQRSSSTATPADVRPKTSRSTRPPLSSVDYWTISEKEPVQPTQHPLHPVELPQTGKDKRNSLQDPQWQEPDLRRASMSFGAARRRRRGQTLTGPPLRIPEHGPTEASAAESHARRPSTSWLHRLSITSFQSDSPSAGTMSPVTSSINGSDSPMLPRTPVQRRVPNKLVKRPSSKRSDVTSLFVDTSASPAMALRRPATSYQKSESMGLQTPFTPDFEAQFSAHSSQLDSPAMSEFDLSSYDTLSPYFARKALGLAQKLTRRMSISGTPRAENVRCLVSNPTACPALVSATAIVNNTNASQDKPSTPVEFRNPFAAPVKTGPATAAPVPQTAPPPRTAPPCAPEKPAHKQSYSVSDIERKKIVVPTVTGLGAPVLGPRGGSLKRVKGRTFSIPRAELPMMATLENMAPISPLAPQRRNITDPTVFRRPPPPSTSGLAVGRQSAGMPRSVSHDYNLGLRERPPLTPDAVAVAAWQDPSRRGSHAHSLRRRPKRHSIAASDPASTIIGSDDTRVFTSGDEYETDMMTDYWDSIRTRETEVNTLHGLRIETMFDKAGTQLSNEEVATLEDLLPRGSFASRVDHDPPLFPSLSPTTSRAHVNDNPSFSDGDDDETHSMIGALPGELNGPSPSAPLTSPSSGPLGQDNPASPSALFFADSHIERNEHSQSAQKMNIFDWSEQARPDRDQSDTDARPSTVHGKQNMIDRGSRAACRKVPSTVHLRSQSVPVARDLPANESRQPSGKFGTWNLGGKGPSEEWDNDFEFDDGEEDDAPSQKTKSTESEVAPQQSMTVPQAILERQASLRGQYGQVQELTLLVEELKRLRHQGSVLGLADGPSAELWKEAEGIINLATIDDEEDRRSPPGSPSSLTFSFDDSDEEGLNAPPAKRDSDSFKPPLKQLSKNPPKSQSVLDILQPPSGHNRSSTLPDLRPSSRAQKLPFDTSSLRNLVVRAGVVTRALKEVIRKAEGVDSNPQTMFPSDPPSDASSTNRLTMILQASKLHWPRCIEHITRSFFTAISIFPSKTTSQIRHDTPPGRITITRISFPLFSLKPFQSQHPPYLIL